ncbi:endochitinase A-like [Daphnia pulicaria]|uniref:endochitinase A-like n=1 Tax=Daphnia pulicaria TaxID=35523 RepID=UPI001EEC6AF5|nr:endochitinase A-like [Daphnia pulicaria]
MKFALIFLMAFVAVSQQFYLQRPNIPFVWLAPHPAARFFLNNYQPLVAFHEDLNRDSADSQSNTDGDQDEYPDVQSRIKGNRPAVLSNSQSQNGRFLANSFGNTNFIATTTTSTFTTISLSTSTSTSTTTSTTTSTSTAVITNTAILSLTSVVKCVPSFQLFPNRVSCGRKKRGIDEEDDEEHHQYVISPSETLELMPTALPSETRELALPAEQLKSSKDEVAEGCKEDKKRDKRLFFLNRNFYTTSTVTATTTSTTVIVIPTTTVTQSISTATAFATTTSTTFVFSNSTVTQIINLINNPVPTVQCQAVAVPAAGAVPAIPQCVACLPVGYVVCTN